MVEVKHFLSQSEEETKAFAKALKDLSFSFKIFALFGDLGVGKTTFAKGFLSSFQIDEKTISSPTYSYVHTFQINSLLIHHFDLYRLQNKEQFLSFGFDEYLDQDAICLIEWPDIIQSILPQKQTVYISLTSLDSELRKIEISHA